MYVHYNHLGHISLEATKTLINTWTDEEIYNQSMSRNTNFKPSDNIKCILKMRQDHLRYIKRLFKSPSKADRNSKKRNAYFKFNDTRKHKLLKTLV
jgi:transposase